MSFRTLLYIRQAYSRMIQDYAFHRVAVACVATYAFYLCQGYLGGIDAVSYTHLTLPTICSV